MGGRGSLPRARAYTTPALLHLRGDRGVAICIRVDDDVIERASDWEVAHPFATCITLEKPVHMFSCQSLSDTISHCPARA